MKTQAFFFLFIATLSCRAETPAAGSTERPDPAPTTAPTTTTATTTAAVTPATTTTMAAVEAEVSTDGEAAAQNLKKDLAALRAEQRAAMLQTLANEARHQKASFVVGILTIEQPKLAMPKLSETAGPAVAFAPVVEAKNRSADAAHSK